MRVIVFLLAFFIQQVYLAEIRVISQCSFPIWIATASNPGKPILPGGTVRLTTGQSYTYPIQTGAGWGGRIWPKVGCGGDGQNCLFGQSSAPCPSGGCQPPADTKVEFFFPPNLSGASWYDISLVDGYSQTVDIVPRNQGGSCVTTKCHIGLDKCPQSEIKGIGDLRIIRNGQLVGCLSPCKKWNYPSPYGLGQPETVSPGLDMCCPTPPISPQQCSSGPVIQTNFVNQVRNNCPSAYSYAYDDQAGLHNCPGESSFDVTFCPSSSGGGTQPNPPCSQWGWKFYDGYDIESNDIGKVWAANRNDCQPACRANSQCKGYSWAAWDSFCYLKSGGTNFIPNGSVFSAMIC